ncbi:hypothetical protein L598_004800000240, partial [Mesorhizobium sp. J18]
MKGNAVKEHAGIDSSPSPRQAVASIHHSPIPIHHFIPAFLTCAILAPSLSAGKRVATAVPRERDRRLRPALVRQGRGGSVQGFPSR